MAGAPDTGGPRSAHPMNKIERKTPTMVTVTIIAEFELSRSISLVDVNTCVSEAMDTLREYGEVKRGTMVVPATTVDLLA